MENKLNANILKKFLKLKQIIQDSRSATVAFSGGVDSTLLAFLSNNILAQKSLIVTVNSEFVSNCELDDVEEISRNYQFRHKIIGFNAFKHPKIKANKPDRCKYCKEEIFKQIIEISKADDIENIFDGSNIDDLNDYRPGFWAIKSLNIRSPFIEADIGKDEIRQISKFLELPNWNKPAMACLASRIPYDNQITTDALEKVEKAERFLNQLGYLGCRVRHHDIIARIELNANNITSFIDNDREKVDKKFKELGYKYVCIDLQGYKAGSLNETIRQAEIVS